jgi:polyisoprenoid-binding protein YceI
MNNCQGGRVRIVSANVLANVFLVVTSAIIAVAIPTSAQVTEFKLDPGKTTVKFTLDAVLHKVEGTFQLKPSALQLDTASGKLSGEILVDAKSGASGNTMRDRKMHRDVLESEQYPEIQFHPDHITGAVVPSGKSSVRVHGMFSIHGVDREIEVPAVVEMTGDSWAAVIHFTVLYAKWGMKNPSNLFLHVSDSVEIDLATAGSVVQQPPETSSGLVTIEGHDSFPFGAFIATSGRKVFVFLGATAGPINDYAIDLVTLF